MRFECGGAHPTRARSRNSCGFFVRVTYHLATAGVAALARRESIYLEQRFSDHAPLIIDYDFDL